MAARPPAITNVEIAAAVAVMQEQMTNLVGRIDVREIAADRVRSEMNQKLTKLDGHVGELLGLKGTLVSDVAMLKGQVVELTAIRNKGVGMLLTLGVIAGIVGGKIAAGFGWLTAFGR